MGAIESVLERAREKSSGSTFSEDGVDALTSQTSAAQNARLHFSQRAILKSYEFDMHAEGQGVDGRYAF